MNNNNNIGFFIDIDKKKFLITESSSKNTPLYFKKGIIPDNFFLENKKIDIINAVDFFKKIKKNTTSEKITIQDIDNIPEQKELVKAATLSGFSNVLVRDWEDSIESIAVPTSNTFGVDSTLFFYKKNNKDYINLYTFENKKIKNTVKYSGSTHDNLIYIVKFLIDQNIKHIYILGDFKNIKEIKQFFFSFKIKVDTYNIWQNFFKIDNFIPNIFYKDSHQYIKSYSLSLNEKTLKEIFRHFYDEIGFNEWNNTLNNYNNIYNLQKEEKKLNNIKNININKSIL